VAVDGEFTSATDRGAAFAAFILGIGASQQQILSGPLSQDVQTRVRNPDKRNAIQKARAATRRRAVCRKVT